MEEPEGVGAAGEGEEASGIVLKGMDARDDRKEKWNS